MPDDESLIRRVLSGDREAFRSLVEMHQSAVCATIRALRPRYADWEDAAQEVFLAAFQHLATFDAAKGTFRTWLLAIARNQCRNARKRPEMAQGETVQDRADGRTPQVLASEAELFQRLDAAPEALSEEQRLVFVLIELQGLSYQEAAEIAEVHVGTVKSRLFRAKEWLREVLRPSLVD